MLRGYWTGGLGWQQIREEGFFSAAQYHRLQRSQQHIQSAGIMLQKYGQHYLQSGPQHENRWSCESWDL